MFLLGKVKGLKKMVLQFSLLENEEHCLKFNSIPALSKYFKNNQLEDVVIE